MAQDCVEGCSSKMEGQPHYQKDWAATQIHDISEWAPNGAAIRIGSSALPNSLLPLMVFRDLEENPSPPLL